MSPPGWLVGATVAIATLHFAIQSGLLAWGIFGLLAVPALAMWAGAGAASIIDARRSRDTINTTIVVGTVVVLFVAYLLIIRARPLPPGSSFGGPNVDPAQPGASKSGPSVFPPP